MISWASFLTILGMLAATYSTRLIGFLALRHRPISSRAAAVMEAALAAGALCLFGASAL